VIEMKGGISQIADVHLFIYLFIYFYIFLSPSRTCI
jgi:hypothetical protein